MKSIFLLLLFPFSVFAQDLEPVRHIDFASRKQAAFFIGEMSVSPKGSMLLATFSDLGEKAIYELITLADGKTISSGSLRSIPYSINWSEDEQLLAMKFKSGNPACYNPRGGMKELFTCSMNGEIAFSRNRSLLTPKAESFLYVFGDEAVHIYTTKGQLKDNVEKDNDYKSYSLAWFDMLNNRFDLLTDSEDEIITFSPAGKIGTSFQLADATDISDKSVDKDGSKYLCRNANGLMVYDAGNGKSILRYPRKEISSACFTPDSKSVMLADKNEFVLVDLKGKVTASAKLNDYYSNLAYIGFGTELVAINPSGADFYPCKNYFPVKKETVLTKPPATEKPVTKTQPVKEVKPVAEQPKWTLPYTVSDFITPLTTDSFYLYSKDKTVRYYIVYQKAEASFLWKNPYNYFQYFGLSNQEKYPLGYIYTFDMTDGEAKIATYYHSIKSKNDLIFGGGNFAAKIPVGAPTASWTNKIYDEQSSLSSRLIDNVYKGRKAKCLVVSRVVTINGTTVNESYYYQQAVGLVKIDSGGKIFER